MAEGRRAAPLTVYTERELAIFHDAKIAADKQKFVPRAQSARKRDLAPQGHRNEEFNDKKDDSGGKNARTGAEEIYKAAPFGQSTIDQLFFFSSFDRKPTPADKWSKSRTQSRF